ncbi:M20/M25/M40 family metallo-hydrolase [Clostridium sp. DMHC 10]|uniref:M20 metallopeptidase family protein n=1 Tax=Clostridium sp. DMHC 10 TaxID=747377 RepID=UPI000AF70E20|nr:M20/M25/M40 family metallo-hydrolase [Clostridium sp. DMHC 10]
MEILDKANEIKEWIVELRRDFHMYPEPSFEEIRTSGIVEQKLKEMDIEVKHIGKTGIVGILRGDKPGKVIGLRADMDALSVYEETGLPFASKKEGFMHACGHDSHISMLLGAAKIFYQI